MAMLMPSSLPNPSPCHKPTDPSFQVILYKLLPLQAACVDLTARTAWLLRNPATHGAEWYVCNRTTWPIFEYHTDCWVVYPRTLNCVYHIQHML